MRNALLIDYEKIITPNSKNLQNLISVLPKNSPLKAKNGFELGLILIVNNDDFEKISKLGYGKERVLFLNILKVIYSCFVLFNENKGICVLDYNTEYLQEILQLFLTNLEPNVLLWVGIPIDKSVIKFVENGFNSPYITTLDPLKNPIAPSIALVRRNIKTTDLKPSLVFNKIQHLIEEYNKNSESCSLYAKFSKNAIIFLKSASKKGITMNKDGTQSQKELTGELEIEDVIKEGNKIIYIIDVNKGSVESGEEEDVNVSATRYNFHSHPEEAYVRHSVSKAWPSVTDYLGYLKLGKSTIFHCVATLEGVYIISFSEYWGNNLKNVSKRFIDKHYDIDHKEDYTPEEYVDKVNKILYKKHPIYILHFLNWKNIENSFQVHFPVTFKTCLVSQEILENYNKIHK